MGLEWTRAFFPPVIAQNLDYLIWGRAREGEWGGLLLTVLLALASMVLSIAGGLGLSLCARLGPRGAKRLFVLWSDLIRGVPLLLVIFWLYFLVPAIGGRGVPDALSVVLALSLFGSASAYHTFESALEALPRGQSEAAWSSGLSRWQTLRFILLPQALRHSLPSSINLLVSLIKDTSLACIVNVPELTTVTGQVNNRELVHPFSLYLFCGALYFALCFGLSRLAGRWKAGRPLALPC